MARVGAGERPGHPVVASHPRPSHYHIVAGPSDHLTTKTKFVLKLKLQAWFPLADDQALWLLSVHTVAADHLQIKSELKLKLCFRIQLK